MLISAVMPIMSIYQLPFGQLGYSGHVINLPQDVRSFTSSLPRSPSNLDIIIVRKEGATQSHRDFQVRRSIVLQALQWLITNNVYYQANHICIDHTTLAQLPEDGNCSNLPTVAVDSSTVREHQAATIEDYQVSTANFKKNDLSDVNVSRSFVPITIQSGMTEQQTIRHSVQERQSTASPASTVMWPSIGSTPINEFTTEGYFSCAFPTLFPSGAADFLGQRQNQVTIGNYFKHLMMFADRRFAKHP